MSTRPLYTDEELREQWAFLDALVSQQAAALRSAPPEPEDSLPLVGHSPATTALLQEVESLRDRVRLLEEERGELMERLRVSDARLAAVQRSAQMRSQPAALRFWRRLRG